MPNADALDISFAMRASGATGPDDAARPHGERTVKRAEARAEERDPGSGRRLEDVGVDTVLGAMIEQRRRSSRPYRRELTGDAADDTDAADAADDTDAADAADDTGQVAPLIDDDVERMGPSFEDTPRAKRVPAHSDAFIKVR